MLHLHSTMYLLNQNQTATPVYSLQDLHSTMYLLNPVPVDGRQEIV